MIDWLDMVGDRAFAHPMNVFLVGGVIWMLAMLWRVQRSPKIDLVDLLLDSDEKASWTKITAIGAFMFASWAASFLVINFGEGSIPFLCFYIAVYSGAPVAYRLIAARSEQPPPTQIQTVTTTAPASSTVTTSSTGVAQE